MEDFGNQVAQYIPRLRRYARALTGERVAADDLVQDTLERAWNKLHLWRERSDLRAWLFTIMHNLFVNQVRRRSADRFVSMDGDAMDLHESAPQGDKLEVRDLDIALRGLPEEQREVLLLIGLEQLSYEEAAKTLGVPIGTVMSRLSRGRERLRRSMTGLPETAPLRVIK